MEAFLTGDREMLVEALLMVYAFDHGGPTTSYAQAKAFVDELLASPEEQDWAWCFPERKQPAWARALQRPASKA